MPVMTGFLGRVVDWLREGYPGGIPAQDTIPVLALLRRRLTDAEVAAIAAELRASGLLSVENQAAGEPAAGTGDSNIGAPNIGAAHIGAQITKLTDELPIPEDIQRVSEHLLFRGFPAHD